MNTAGGGAGSDPTGTRSVVVSGAARGFAQEVRVGSHRLLSDEPASAGGTDTGPDPYGYLLAALGSCTSMTLALYARGKRWPLESVKVELRHSRVHAADCESCETKGRPLDRIERDVELTGPLSPHQRARLLEIADKCPVHRTLMSDIDIRTRLV